MAEPGNSAANARCPACGFENAPHSLFCKDCGAKLEIAPPSYLAGPAAEIASPGAAPKAAPVSRKPCILSARRHRPVGAFLGTSLRIVIYAAIVAAVIQILRAPRDLPQPGPPIDAKVVADVRARLADAAQRGIPVDAPWPRTNAYLASVLAPGANESPVAASFVRALLTPEPGGFALTIQKTVAHIPIYTTVNYELVSRGGALALVRTGAAIGRMPLPAMVAPLVESTGGDLSGALKFELDILRGARTVQFSPATAHIEFARARP
ncbi:MAG: zinc ribbon domain-containing protein [Terrimicrobiaceae bacterium]|nr:zinc ribbon domain-containing protein [Terrimicrobiaceae bacterium]